MCLTTLRTLSVLWPLILTVLVAVLLLRLSSTLVSCFLVMYVYATTWYVHVYISTHTHTCNYISVTAGCVVPVSPVNGDWQAFTPSTTVGPGTSLSLSCSPGYVPSEVMSSTCQFDGSWEPDTADLNCTAGMYSVWSMHDYFVRVRINIPLLHCAVDCGPPTLAANVTVEPSLPNNTTFGSTFSFRCAEGFFPNGIEQAMCGADGQWRPDPANHGCGDGNCKLSVFLFTSHTLYMYMSIFNVYVCVFS